MASVQFEDSVVQVPSGSSVLEALISEGHDIPNSCRAGSCQSCMLQATDGSIPAASQRGLKSTYVEQGMFLACCCHPEGDLTIQRRGDVAAVAGTVVEKSMLTDSVLRLRIKAALDYRAGQYVNLIRPEDGLTRAYSIASVADKDDYLEFHIRVYPDGQFSRWAKDTLALGDALNVQGPFGDCFYTPMDQDDSVILAGTGTGLAPLYGIVYDALRQGHMGSMHLFAGAKTTSDLYLVDELIALSHKYPTFSFTPVVMVDGGVMPEGVQVGDINAVIKAQYPKTTGMRAYFCGSETRVKNLRKQTFLGGASMQSIFCDLFTPAYQSDT
ncbi:MAG: FAD-binding oxidoreductase [Pontibacterium sp.]